MLTRYLAEDLGARGIIVNTIAPGPTATDFSGGLGPTQELHGRQSLVPSGGASTVSDDIEPKVIITVVRYGWWGLP